MSVTERLITDTDYREKYFNKLNELDSQKKQFQKILKQSANNAKKAKKKTKKDGKNTIVSKATGKKAIQRLIRTLNEKISEIQNENDDQKLKTAKIALLNMKISGLQRILSGIEQDEREKIINDTKEKRDRSRRKSNEKVYLTKDDLTIKGKSGDTNQSPNTDCDPLETSSVDLSASFQDSIMKMSSDLPEIDIQL